LRCEATNGAKGVSWGEDANFIGLVPRARGEVPVIAFPVLKRLRVVGYPLYPGPNGDQVMDMDLDQGPWVILGVNGLGKTTLLLLMRYLLSGAVRLREAGFAGEREDLLSVYQRLFAVRVAGEARGATATLTAQIGPASVTVERHIENLSLANAKITEAGEITALTSEVEYRAAIARLMRVARFDDAVRIFDFVTFFFEMRQPLLWNVAAQFELFRAIITPENSKELRRLEGVIVSADSLARNLNASLFSIQKRRNAEARKALNADSTRAKLAATQAAYDEAVASEQKSQALVEVLEGEVEDALLQVKRSEKDVDDASREYELLKYNALKEAFEGVPLTEQYIFLRLLSDRVCLVCNHDADETAETLERRLKSGLCPVCGSPRATPATAPDVPFENLADKAELSFATLIDARAILDERRRSLSGRMTALVTERQRAATFAEDAQIHARQIRTLQKQLPAEDRARMEQETARLAALREQVEISRRERTNAEDDISGLLTHLKEATEQIRLALEQRFDDVARPFFAERVKLVYAPRESRIGQQGRIFSFPAFEVELTSGATHGDFVRRTADQVSLSQRDYLDLIFRMAIVDVLGGRSGTLAVDGPEGPVDAVFAERAGDLFAEFSYDPGKNVVLACNIVEGGFIPHTLKNYANNPEARVIDLLDQAVPTAALLELRPQYQKKVDEIFERTRKLV
jgi:hypothetical protein